MAVLVGVFIIVFVAALRVGIDMHKQHFWETLLKQALPPVRSLLPDAQLEDHDIKFKLHGCDAYIQWYFPDMGDDCTIFYVKFPQKQPSMTASLDAVKFSVSLKSRLNPTWETLKSLTQTESPSPEMIRILDTAAKLHKALGNIYLACEGLSGHQASIQLTSWGFRINVSAGIRNDDLMRLFIANALVAFDQALWAADQAGASLPIRQPKRKWGNLPAPLPEAQMKPAGYADPFDEKDILEIPSSDSFMETNTKKKKKKGAEDVSRHAPNADSAGSLPEYHSNPGGNNNTEAL